MVTVPSRPGVTQSFVIADMAARVPQAVAVLYVGGGGSIRLRMEEGRVKFGARNFLPRSREEFARNAIVPVIIDAPSDRDELTDDYRASEANAADARAVVAELKKRYPGLPLYIVGTSRGTLSAAYVGRALGQDVSGVVLTSTVFTSPPRRAALSLAGFDYAGIRTPLLFVHHRDDSCPVTPYSAAASVGHQYPLISVRGGKPAESSPCEPLAPHGFYGKEAETVDAIAAWMLKRPFPKDIN
ncbi:MAG TPA: alpha/beta hydrolase [Burkholderiales bacterium]|nr:alpha/beta hydrolase [Burkholderiales bacterium]